MSQKACMYDTSRGVSPVYWHRPWPIHLFGILLHLFSLSSVKIKGGWGGWGQTGEGEMREEKDGRSGQYKRMKRKGEEGVGRGRDRERKRTYERQEAPVGTPAEHLSLKRLLLSITVSSPRFFHLSLLSGRRRDTQRGKERVLKILPSFLCPSPLLKTCHLHSNRPCLHTELIQLAVMNVCVCGRDVERGAEKERERQFCCCSCLSVSGLCVSVPLSAWLFCFFFFSKEEFVSLVNISPTLHLNSKASSFLVDLNKCQWHERSIGWFLNCKKCFSLWVLNQAPWRFSPPCSKAYYQRQPQSVLALYWGKAWIVCLSAAGGGRDGAVVQVSRVHNRNWEVENERRGGRGCRWGGGCRGLGSEQRACRGGGFGGARGGEELRLELQQLAHEAEVGGDDAAAPPYKLERFVQTYPLSLHQVGQADGGRAGDACLTVHQHSPTGVPYWIWEDRGERVGKVSKK